MSSSLPNEFYDKGFIDLKEEKRTKKKYLSINFIKFIEVRIDELDKLLDKNAKKTWCDRDQELSLNTAKMLNIKLLEKLKNPQPKSVFSHAKHWWKTKKGVR